LIKIGDTLKKNNNAHGSNTQYKPLPVNELIVHLEGKRKAVTLDTETLRKRQRFILPTLGARRIKLYDYIVINNKIDNYEKNSTFISYSYADYPDFF
jgi:hypothetical protein